MFVLDFAFGPNSYATRTGATHKFYIHERVSVPDIFNIKSQGILIHPGQKHDITFSAAKAVMTRSFSELPISQRDCILPEELPLGHDKVTSGKFRFYDQYTQINCVTEIILEETTKSANCTPWDIAEYIGLDDYQVSNEMFKFWIQAF